MQNLLSRVVRCSIYLLVLLVPIFFLPFSFEVFEYSKQYLVFFLVSLGCFAWIAKQVFYDKEIKFKKSPINYLVLAFLLVSILSAVFSADRNSSVFGFYGRFSDGLIGILSLGVLYFLIINNVEAVSAPEGDAEKGKKLQISKLLNLFLWAVGITVFVSYFSVLGIWSKVSNFLPLKSLMTQRTFNPVSGSLEGLAVFLSLAVMLLTGLLLVKNLKQKASIIYYLLLFSSLGLLMIIGFKAAWIVLLVSMILFAGASLIKRVFRDNVNQLLIPMLLIIVAVVFLIWQPIKMSLPQEQVLGQSVSWQVAVKSATDGVKNVFLGSGLGTFQYDFAKYKPQNFNQTWLWQIRFDRAGSHLAELLGGSGFLGLTAYLALAVLVLIISWFLLTGHSLNLPLTMVFLALLVGQFVYYQNTSLAFVFWLTLGLLVVSWREKNAALGQEKSISFKSFPELSLLASTAVIIFGIAILGFYFCGIKYYLADASYFKALTTSGEPRIKGLEKAVNLNPGLPQYRTVLGRAYLTEILTEIQKPTAEQDSAKIQLMVSRSIDQAKTATTLGPNQIANWETLGIIYREIQGVATGATEWGIKSLEEAIKLEPTNPVLYTELGKLYLASGDKEKARDYFNKSLEQKSDYVSALIQLSLLLEQENKTDEAIVKMENAVMADSFNVDALFQLGRLYFNNKRTDEAILLFQRITTLTPGHSNAHYSLGVAYASKGEKELAIQEFEKVLELNPDNQDVVQKLKDLKGE